MKKILTSALSRRNRIQPESLRPQFEEQLRQLYWCERELAEVLPALAKSATSYELTSAILGHLAVTENQVIRLIHVFDAIGERAVPQRNPHVADLIAAHESIDLVDSGFERDSEIINCCQKLMQYEMTTYQQLHQTALKLREEQAAEFLALGVKEERTAYERLNEIRLSAIYFDAAS